MKQKKRKTLIGELVRSEGACCPYAYFTVTGDIPTRIIAERLGVTPRAVRKYRQKILAGEIACECAAACYLTNNHSDSS